MLTVSAVVGLLLLTGCSSGEQQRAQSTADEFFAAVEARDGAAACALLAPATVSELEQSAQKNCATAVLHKARPDVGSSAGSQVYDTMAQIRYADDTVFLTRMGDDWRVMAAVCSRPSDARAYDCQVKGG